MAVKNNRRTVMTKTLLKRALIELMLQKPFAQISIKDICRQADLNRSTFYLHYTDQTALMKEIEKELEENSRTYLSGIRPSREASEMIEVFLKYIREEDDVFRVIFTDMAGDRYYVVFMQRMLEMLRINIPVYEETNDTANAYVLTFLLQGSI